MIKFTYKLVAGIDSLETSDIAMAADWCMGDRPVLVKATYEFVEGNAEGMWETVATGLVVDAVTKKHFFGYLDNVVQHYRRVFSQQQQPDDFEEVI
jgi:hypothetical protein